MDMEEAATGVAGNITISHTVCILFPGYGWFGEQVVFISDDNTKVSVTYRIKFGDGGKCEWTGEDKEKDKTRASITVGDMGYKLIKQFWIHGRR